jgi:hypothetical protein
MADEKKGEVLPPSALIPVGGNNFSKMTDSSQLSSMEAGAPPFHSRVLNALKATGKVREDQVISRASQPDRNTGYDTIPVRKKLKFVNGARVKNLQGKKLTIIQASAGHTKKGNILVHKVANKEGESWLEKESELTLLL